jgi:hypothetical protein
MYPVLEYILLLNELRHAPLIIHTVNIVCIKARLIILKFLFLLRRNWGIVRLRTTATEFSFFFFRNWGCDAGEYEDYYLLG